MVIYFLTLGLAINDLITQEQVKKKKIRKIISRNTFCHYNCQQEGGPAPPTTHTSNNQITTIACPTSCSPIQVTNASLSHQHPFHGRRTLKNQPTSLPRKCIEMPKIKRFLF